MTASFQESVDAIICLAVHMQGMSPIEFVATNRPARSHPAARLCRRICFSCSRLCCLLLARSHGCAQSLSWSRCARLASQGRHVVQMRLQMTARNKLVIVRDADENLQIPLSKKMKVHLTQQMSDQVTQLYCLLAHQTHNSLFSTRLQPLLLTCSASSRR